MRNTTRFDSTQAAHRVSHDANLGIWVTVGLVCVANVLAISKYVVPYVGPAIGFWFLIVQPTYLLSTMSFWRNSRTVELIGFSLTGVLLYLMLGGLGINALLPLLGMEHPLSPIPVAVLVDALIAGLLILRRRYPTESQWRGILSISPIESRFLVTSGLCVVLAILGANRLNNGANNDLGILALSILIAVFVFLLIWGQKVREGVICCVIYMLSLALLLMTSLRGWFVTGHDIQTEYRVYQLTAAHDHWSISYFHNAYNACLSITILPTEFLQILHIDPPYVYKLFFQFMFSMCPVLVYAIARRYWNRTIAIMATAYFVGFPTFFTDMPFLNRQEIAYLFVCVAILAVTNSRWNLWWRRSFLFAACLGIELSHYSTMYVFLVTLTGAWVISTIIKLSRGAWKPRENSPRPAAPSWATISNTVSLSAIVVVAAIAFMWGGLATGTAGAAVTDATTSITGFFGNKGGAQAGSVSYGLVHGQVTSPESILENYRNTSLKQSAQMSSQSVYESPSIAAKYPTPVVNEPSLPTATLGRFISNIGIPVSVLNSAIREAAAKGEQVFVLIGLICFLVLKSYRRRIGREFFSLCVGAILLVALLTVLPGLSIDYGILRAFQEALILIAPVLVVGSLVFFRILGARRGLVAAGVVCIGLLSSTTGLLPEVLGGYPAQLSLNNSGQYYQMYYTQPQEVSAIDWLSYQPETLPTNVQAENYTDRFTFTTLNAVSGQQVLSDIYPTVILKSSWVVLGYTTVRTGIATTAANAGPLITYKYPIGFLRATKNLVFNDGGSEIYK